MKSITASSAFATALLSVLVYAAPALGAEAAPADTRAAAVGVAGDAGKPGTPAASLAEAAPAPTKKWRLSAKLGTSYVGGLINSGTDLSNPPAGASIVGFGATYNPALDFSLALGASWKFTDKITGSASYRLSKGFAFDDRGEYHPGNAGSTSTQLIDTGDLGLELKHGKLLFWEKAKITVSGAVSGTIPASRTSLFCNPLYGALGVEVGAERPFEVGLGISVSTGFAKPFYANSAPPRSGVGGACSSPLANYDATSTLSGSVSPTSDRDRWVAAARLNTNWAWSAGVGVSNWHSLLALAIPKLRDGKIWKKISTSIGAGLKLRQALRDPEYTVMTATGPYVVEASNAPVVLTYTFSVSAGYSINDHLGLGLRFSNEVPQLLYDPATYYAAWLPATTISLTVSGSY